MATDYWVKRFGFMWAGGRSGMKGMEALQVRQIFEGKNPLSIFQFQKTADLTYSNEIPTSVYNPSGMYGLKAMGVSSQLRSDLLPNMAIISLSDWGFDI